MTSPHPGAKIRALRKALNPPLTQEALAERAECSRSLIEAIESGRRSITDDMLRRFAAVFRVEVEQIDPDYTPDTPVDPVAFVADLRARLDQFVIDYTAQKPDEDKAA